MKKLVLALFVLIIVSSFAYAQIVIPDKEKTVCGDGIREGHEMCEPDTDQNLCEAAGKIIGIYMGCDPRDCTCIPDRMDCGNEIREGVEFCDPGKKENPEENDFCDELGELFNETMTCDPKTCLCKPEKAYNYTEPVCGNGIIEETEDCEKDTDCRTDQICDRCSCTIKPRNITEQIKEATEEPKAEPKTEESEEFDYHSLVGAVLPEILAKNLDEARINVHVTVDDNTETLVGVITSHGVVQEFEDEGLENPSFDAYVKKSLADSIINAENRTDALVKAVEDGEITYKPRGFFNKIVFWLKSLFS